MFHRFIRENVKWSVFKGSSFNVQCFGLHGACLTFGIVSGIIIIILHIYLPETKDKTLQQIADSMNGVKSNKSEVTSKLLAIYKAV